MEIIHPSAPSVCSWGLNRFSVSSLSAAASPREAIFHPYRLLHTAWLEVSSARPLMLALPFSTDTVYPPPEVPGVLKVMRPLPSERYQGTPRWRTSTPPATTCRRG